MITRRSLFKLFAALPLVKLLPALPKPEVFMPLSSMQIGDCFTIAGVYAVNPRTLRRVTYIDKETGVPVSVLQTFVYCGGESVLPHRITYGPYQNCEMEKGVDLNKRRLQRGPF